MIGSDLVVPSGMTRAEYIRSLFNVARTKALLGRRRKSITDAAANAVLDRLVAWDEEQDLAPNTHQLSVQYNKILDEV